jgi:hypothetical protein
MDNRLSGKQVCAVVATVLVVLTVTIWVFFQFVAPNLPESKASLAQSEEAARLTATALQKFLPGQEVHIERRFANNLKLYVDRNPFEEITNPDRKAVMSELGRLWCDNIAGHWLARVSVVDVRSGDRLANYTCAFRN